MNKGRINNLLDYIPLIIITISAIVLIWTVATSDIKLSWKHFIGISFLPVNYLLFFRRHKMGVLSLAVTLLLGLSGFLSYSPSISTVSLYIGANSNGIPLFYGQPVFLLWLLIHFIVSARHYFGILTAKYWQALF